MRDRRRKVLDTIQRAAEPVGVSEIADHLGVHPNTVRFHLEALVGDRIIERPPRAKPRPRKVTAMNIDDEGRGRAVQVQVRRVYETPEDDDGVRILVDRIWPRGLTKTRAALHEWCKNVAPSTELRKWYGHDPDRFPEFTRRYRVELAAPERSDALSHLADELRGTGWPNEAEGVVAALDEIRGAYGGRNYPFDDSLIVLYDRLRQLSESAANVAELIRTCYAEPHHR